MPRYKDEPPVVRIYTVCDESRYLIVRNVHDLGCGDELSKLFGSCGEVEECKPMDEADCEPNTEVYWIKFRLVSNARFAKRKFDEYVFFAKRLKVSYAPEFESLADTKDKLEGRRREVLGRLNSGSPKRSALNKSGAVNNPPPLTRISSEKEYFASQSMNQTVKMVREKLDKIESSSEHLQDGRASKKPRVDNRRRI